MLHSIYDQTETEAVAAPFDRVVDAVMVRCDLASGAMCTARFTVALGRGLVVAVRPDTEVEAAENAGNEAMFRPTAGVDAPRATTALR